MMLSPTSQALIALSGADMVTVEIDEKDVTVGVTEAPVLVDVQSPEISIAATESTVTIVPDEKTVLVSSVDGCTVDITVEDASPVVVAIVESDVNIAVAEPIVEVVTQEDIVDITITESNVEVDVGLCVQLVGPPSFTQTRVAGATLLPGTIVAINANNHVVPADPVLSNGLCEAVGASAGAYTAGNAASVYSYHGRLTRVLFDAIPQGTDDGKIVYLVAPGIAGLSPPSSAGDCVVKLGVLSGADGTLTPEIFLSIDVLNPDDFSHRETVALAKRRRVKDAGVQYLGIDGVMTSLVPLTMPTDVFLDKIVVTLDRTDVSRDFELRVEVDSVVEVAVPIPAGAKRASLTGLSVFVPEGGEVAVLLARTTGVGPSNFRACNSLLTYRGI